MQMCGPGKPSRGLRGSGAPVLLALVVAVASQYQGWAVSLGHDLFISWYRGNTAGVTLTARQTWAADGSGRQFAIAYTPKVADDWGQLFQGVRLEGFPQRGLAGNKTFRFEYMLDNPNVAMFLTFFDGDDEAFTYDVPLHQRLHGDGQWHEFFAPFADFAFGGFGSTNSGNKRLDLNEIRSLGVVIVAMNQVGETTHLSIRSLEFRTAMPEGYLPTGPFVSWVGASPGATVDVEDLPDTDGAGTQSVVSYTPHAADGWQTLFTGFVVRGLPQSGLDNATSLTLSYALTDPDLQLILTLEDREDEAFTYEVSRHTQLVADGAWHTLAAPLRDFEFGGFSSPDNGNKRLDLVGLSDLLVNMVALNQAGVTTVLKLRIGELRIE